MLLTVHVLVDLAKRRRESTGSYSDGRGNDRSVHTAGSLRGNLAFGGHISTRYFWPVRLPSRTYKSNLQSKEKQPQTVTPPSPKQLCPKCGCPEMKCFVGMRARRPIKRPQLTLRHRHARFDWAHDHLRWTIRTWRRIHWSDESRFLLRPTDGRARAWHEH
jgi:hypothetical protein